MNVQTGAGRVHVKYTGVKNGKPYHGYASMPYKEGWTAQDVIDYRYNNNFDDFDVAPQSVYSGEGIQEKVLMGSKQLEA